MRALLVILFLCVPLTAQADGVVVTIKPLHAIASAIMHGSGMEPKLLVAGKSSLHDFSLKPSQMEMLHHADAVIYMSPHFETFLEKILPQLPAGTRRIAAEDMGLTLYPLRAGDDDHAAGPDLHAWMLPSNMDIIASGFARQLSELYPEHQPLFMANLRLLQNKLRVLDKALKTRMQALKGKPFATFHDATQYFDIPYGLRYAGSLTLHPEQGLSAQKARALRARIGQMQVKCIFSEPGFDPKIVKALAQGTGVTQATLDAEGVNINAGPDFYFQLMDSIARTLESCLQ